MLSIFFLSAIVVDLPHPVRGDFDHDGKIDVAQIVPGRANDYQLVIKSGDRAHSIYVIDKIKRDAVSNVFLAKMMRGRWTTWCGKGGGEEGEPCPRRSLTIRADALTYGTKEASQAVALWTGGHFEVVWLDD
ncbi:MAG: hypothetical protein K2P68_05340 [Sphingomonas sp.]|nr:hypothetical protein [Sphingomonas sp.]